MFDVERDAGMHPVFVSKHTTFNTEVATFTIHILQMW
jgi:hypothetical protein